MHRKQRTTKLEDLQRDLRGIQVKMNSGSPRKKQGELKRWMKAHNGKKPHPA